MRKSGGWRCSPLAEDAVQIGARCVFLDIGAHWGIYALWAQSSGLFDRVIAVEADPRNAAQLHANLYLNDLAGVIDVYAAAAGARARRDQLPQPGRPVQPMWGPG